MRTEGIQFNLILEKNRGQRLDYIRLVRDWLRVFFGGGGWFKFGFGCYKCIIAC